MKLEICTKRGLIVTSGLDQETVDEFINDYRNDTARVMRVPDTDTERQSYVTREYVIDVTTGPDDVEVPVEPVAGDAEGAPATEESGTP